MAFRVPLGLDFWGWASWGQEGSAGVLEAFLCFLCGCDFFRSWRDFGRVLGAKMEAKIHFWEMFFRFFFESVFVLIFGCFWEAPNPENMHGA